MAVIAKRAVSKFLERPRSDFRPYKELTHRALDAWGTSLPCTPPHWHSLLLHQKVCFRIGVETSRFLFLLDTGMGKTFLSVALARYFRKAGTAKRHLVLVPNKSNTVEWVNDIRKHSPKTSHVILAGSSKRKWELLGAGNETLVITTYAGLFRMVCELVAAKKGPRKKLQPTPRLVKRLASQFQGLFMDESTSVKTKGKLPFRICRQIAKHTSVAFGLTGTPFGREPAEMWGQFFLVDGGYTLGETLGLFRAAFYRESDNHWGGKEYTYKGDDELINRIQQHRSIRYVAEEGDLPPVVEIVKEVRLPADARDYYDKAKEAIIAAHGNYQEMKNAFLRMRQISSGFLGYKDDEIGVRAQYEFTPNPKLDMLLSTIETIPPDRKIVVFHEYTFSGSVLCRELDAMGIGHVRLYGKTKDPEIPIAAFANDPDKQVFVLQNASGSFGLDRLKVAQYMMYYESPVSPIIRKQTRRRVERQYSQHDKVFQYDFVCRGTVDQQVLDAIATGADLFDAIVEGKKSL